MSELPIMEPAPLPSEGEYTNELPTPQPARPTPGAQYTKAKQWAVAAAAGAAAISLTNFIGYSFSTGDRDSGIFVLLRLGAPVGVMAWYALRAYRSADNNRAFPAVRAAEVGNVADSLYFLGFLWTLWALIDSFVIHGMSIAQAVFRTFGYALVTTASGMFLRLFFLQLQHSDKEGWAKTELDLGRELTKVNSELSGFASSLESFRTNTDRALSAWTESLNKSTASVRAAVGSVQAQTTDLDKALIKIHSDAEMRLTERLEKLETELGQRLENRFALALDQLTGKLAPSLERFNTANRTYAEEVNVGTAAIKTSTRNAVTNIEEQTAGLNKSLASLQHESETKLNERVARLETQLNERVENKVMIALNQLTKGLAPALERLNSANRTYAEQIEAGTTAIKASFATAAARVEQTTRAATASVQSSAQQTSKEISAMPVQIVSAIESRLVRADARRARPWWKLW